MRIICRRMLEQLSCLYSLRQITVFYYCCHRSLLVLLVAFLLPLLLVLWLSSVSLPLTLFPSSAPTMLQSTNRDCCRHYRNKYFKASTVCICSTTIATFSLVKPDATDSKYTSIHSSGLSYNYIVTRWVMGVVVPFIMYSPSLASVPHEVIAIPLRTDFQCFYDFGGYESYLLRPTTAAINGEVVYQGYDTTSCVPLNRYLYRWPSAGTTTYEWIIDNDLIGSSDSAGGGRVGYVPRDWTGCDSTIDKPVIMYVNGKNQNNAYILSWYGALCDPAEMSSSSTVAGDSSGATVIGGANSNGSSSSTSSGDGNALPVALMATAAACGIAAAVGIAFWASKKYIRTTDAFEHLPTRRKDITDVMVEDEFVHDGELDPAESPSPSPAINKAVPFKANVLKAK
eukprot:Lankesteria_metandrocarpae@DN5377_c0_g1_i1.p1